MKDKPCILCWLYNTSHCKTCSRSFKDKFKEINKSGDVNAPIFL